MLNMVICIYDDMDTKAFLVPESVISKDDLNSINNVIFNNDDLTDAQWEVYTALHEDTPEVVSVPFPINAEQISVSNIYIVYKV